MYGSKSANFSLIFRGGKTELFPYIRDILLGKKRTPSLKYTFQSVSNVIILEKILT